MLGVILALGINATRKGNLLVIVIIEFLLYLDTYGHNSKLSDCFLYYATLKNLSQFHRNRREEVLGQ